MAIDFIAGCIGGCAGVVVGHPFDTVKVKLQTQDFRNPVYRGTWDCFAKVLRTESIAGVYRGVSSPMAGVAVVNAMVFGVHGMVQRRVSNPNTLQSHFFAGSMAGLAQSVVSSPVELIKTRVQTNSQYSSVMDCLKYTFHQEGICGVFKGLGITAVREFFGYGLYFATYEALTQRSPDKEPVGTAAMLLAGGLSGTVSWVFTYPLDVIKTRLQADGTYSGVVDCLKKSVSAEGLSCLSRGLVPTLLRAFPTNAVTFTVVTWVFRFTEYTTENAKMKENINIMFGYLSGHQLYCLEDGPIGNVSVKVCLGKLRRKQYLNSSEFWVDDGNVDYHWHGRNTFI